jgi:hypothetical protein
MTEAISFVSQSYVTEVTRACDRADWLRVRRPSRCVLIDPMRHTLPRDLVIFRSCKVILLNYQLF